MTTVLRSRLGATFSANKPTFFNIRLDLNLLFRRFLPGISNCTCDFVRQFPRHGSNNFVRMHVGVHVPEDGEIGKKQSLRNLPKNTAKKAYTVPEVEKKSNEFFRSLMGEMHVLKHKNLIAIEGNKLVKDALEFGLNLRYLFILKSLKSLPDFIQRIVDDYKNRQSQNEYFGSQSKRETEVHLISLKALQEWTSVVTPPGIIGVFDKPSEAFKSKCLFKPPRVPLNVVLDNIREPGNLGAIMRTAAGIGCGVLLSQGCTDPWNMKALRSGDGAQFLVPMTHKVDLSSFHQYIPIFDFQPNEIASNASESPCINQYSEQEVTKSGIGIFLADSGDGEDTYGIPIVPYTSIKYPQFQSVYLCLGGETHGLSHALRKAVVDLKSIYPEDIKIISRVKIPMHTSIDSLNAANAFGIIGYEIARQFTNNFAETSSE